MSTHLKLKRVLKSLCLPLCLILLIIGVALLLRHFPEPSFSHKLSSSPFYAAAMPDASGKIQYLKQYQNKIVVVNFWATWCAPCREEMPELVELQNSLKDKNVVVIGIALDQPAQVIEFLKTTPVNYPILVSEVAGSLLGEQLGNDKGVLPYTVVINSDGEIATTHFGRINKVILETAILPLLPSKR